MVGSIAYAGSVHDYVSDVDAGLMSALGHKRTCAVQKGMSALPPKADMRGEHVLHGIGISTPPIP